MWGNVLIGGRTATEEWSKDLKMSYQSFEVFGSSLVRAMANPEMAGDLLSVLFLVNWPS